MAVIGDAYIVVRAITAGFERDVKNAVRGINLEDEGRRVSGTFSRAFGDGLGGGNLQRSLTKFRREAEQARIQFQSLVRTSFTLTAALGPLIAGIGSLAGGFVSLVSILGAATPSLVVLPGLFTAIGLAAAGTAAAFSGVGKAVSAGLQQSTKATQADSTAKINAARRVEDAESRLEDARIDAARAARDALRAQIEAQEEYESVVTEANDAELEALMNLADVRARIAEQATADADRIAEAEADASQIAIDNAKQEADALRRLTQVQEDNSERITEANNRLREAQENLTKALADGREEVQQLGFDAEGAAISEKKAAIELEKARETLLRTQDLPPNTRARREAQLAFAEAELNLRKAKDRNSDLAKEQNRIAGDPTRTQGYIEAVDRQKEAEINAAKVSRDALRSQLDAEQAVADVRERNAQRTLDAQKKIDDAVKTAAKNALEASTAEMNALINLTRVTEENQKRIEDAKKNMALVAESNAEKIADADRRIKDAERDLARAIEDEKKVLEGGATAVDNYANALKGLSPEAQKFVKFIVGKFVPALKELRDAIASTLLPAIQEGLTTLLNDLFPVLEPLLKKFGTSIGKAFNTIVAAVVDPENLGDLEKVFDTSGNVVEGLGTTIANVFDSILSILVAADPIIRKFTDFLSKKTGQFAEFLDTKEASGELEAFFNKSGEVAAGIGEVLGNAFSGFVNIIKANFSEGGGGYILLQYFKDVTAEFEKFSGSTEGQNKLSEYFKGAAENSKSILGFFGQLVKAILKVGADPNVGKFFDILKEGVPTFEKILAEAAASGPALAQFINSVGKFTLLTMESGAITTFFNTLRSALDGINKVLENDIVMGILKVTGTVFAFLSALGLIGKVAGFAFKVLAGNVIRVLVFFGRLLGIAKLANLTLATLNATLMTLAKRAIAAVIGGLRALGVALLTNPVGLFITVLGGLVALFIVLYTKSESFREAVTSAFDKVKNAAETAFNWIKTNWPLILAILTGPIGLAVLAIVKNWDEIVAFVKGVPQKIKDAAGAMWDWIKEKLSAAWEGAKTIFGNIVTWVKDLPSKLVQAAGGMWSWVSSKLQGAYDSVKAKFDEMVEWVKGLPGRITKAASGLWNGIIDSFKTSLNWIIGKWNSFKISARIPANPITTVLGIAGKGFDLETPDILPLAKGGIVMPSTGGTIARIAEAGRPERVEPLDEDGLSRRDRAMISLLSGGVNGATFNIYPSQGMNESELASMISRQIAFQLRKGGA